MNGLTGSLEGCKQSHPVMDGDDGDDGDDFPCPGCLGRLVSPHHIGPVGVDQVASSGVAW